MSIAAWGPGLRRALALGAEVERRQIARRVVGCDCPLGDPTAPDDHSRTCPVINPPKETA